MKANQKIRMIADVAMMILLPFLMAYSLVGEAVHEGMGIVMALLFILHHVLNIRWYRNLTRGRWPALRIWGTMINGLLMIVMIALPVSGIMMSRHIFHFPAISSGISIARQIHLLASHWGFLLMGLHLGLHWNMVMGMMKKAAGAGKISKLSKAMPRLFALLLSLYGIYAFVQLQYGSYLFLQNQFVFFDFSKPLVLSLAERGSVLCLFVCISYYVAKFLQKHKKQNKEVESNET